MMADDPVAGFADAMRAVGIEPPGNIKADGRLHRFSTNGRRRDDAGYYLLHVDGIPAGIFGDWRTHAKGKWCARRPEALTPEEREACRARIEKAKKEAAAARARERGRAAKRAAEIWTKATPAREDHPYLVRKSIKPIATLRELPADAIKSLLGYAPAAKGETLAGRILIVPIGIDTKIVNVEMIDQDGRKAFLFGGAVFGGYWATGKLPEGDGEGPTILIGEGVATALSAAEATGQISAAALSAGNLPEAAKALRKRLPRARLIMLADLDERGVGLAKTAEAALAVDGLVAVPDFGPERPGGAKDFNDCITLLGPEAVCAAIEAAWKPGETSADAAKPELKPAAESYQEQSAPEEVSEVEENRAPPFSVEALALDFAAKHAAELRYVAEWSHWFRWRGSRWTIDSTLWAFHMARVICRAVAARADEKAVKMRLTDGKTEATVERLAKADPRLAAEIDQWESDLWLLNMEVKDGHR